MQFWIAFWILPLKMILIKNFLFTFWNSALFIWKLRVLQLSSKILLRCSRRYCKSGKSSAKGGNMSLTRSVTCAPAVDKPDLDARLQNAQLWRVILSNKQGVISKCEWKESSRIKTIFQGRILKVIQNCIEYAKINSNMDSVFKMHKKFYIFKNGE